MWNSVTCCKAVKNLKNIFILSTNDCDVPRNCVHKEIECYLDWFFFLSNTTQLHTAIFRSEIIPIRSWTVLKRGPSIGGFLKIVIIDNITIIDGYNNEGFFSVVDSSTIIVCEHHGLVFFLLLFSYRSFPFWQFFIRTPPAGHGVVQELLRFCFLSIIIFELSLHTHTLLSYLLYDSYVRRTLWMKYVFFSLHWPEARPPRRGGRRYRTKVRSARY